MEPTVFQFIGGTVSNATDAFVGPAAAKLMTALQAFALAAVTLYVLLMGMAILMGQVQAPISKFLTQSFKIVLITAIALTADTYSAYVTTTFAGLEKGLADALSVGPADASNIYQVLDKTLGQGMEVVNTCFRNADEAGWSFGSVAGWVLAGSVVALGTTAVVVLGGAAIIVAKFALAIMFALGPLFILLLIFPVTSRFFDSWFAQVISYILLIVIIAVIMSFAMAAFGAFVGAADVSGGGEVNPLMVAAEVLALSFVLVFLIYQAYGMAAGLAGGLSMAALTAAHVLTPGRMARNAIDPITTRRDLQSGMMTTARRSNQIVAGNTIINPAYRQQLAQQIGRNWGKSKGGNVKP